MTKSSRRRRRVVPLAAIAALALFSCAVDSTAEPAATATLEEPPRYGVYYDRYEPTFYTGFAPRIPDPRRLLLRIGRGNQLRVTAVLGDDVLRSYARDLLARQRTYRALVDQGRIVLTQNQGLEEFEATLAAMGLAAAVADETRLADDDIRARNLALMERLNPGRVFRIRLVLDDLLQNWAARLTAHDRVQMTRQRRLELLNAMLPTRVHVLDVDASTASALEHLVRRCMEAGHGNLASVREDFRALLARVSGVYQMSGDAADLVEFTAVYPVGTLNDTVSVRGKRIPLYPVTGRRALVVHQRTRLVDHIPEDVTYSYSPWIPYIHIGTRLHDALHTLFWRMKPAETRFLPPAWRSATNLDGKPYEYLWLLSRGPMSHGCTHVNVGHLAELRQMLPAEEEKLAQVDLFLDKSELYDVFDVDGDHVPEVMGVRYWIAFSLQNDEPDALRAPNRRCAYYDWLYAGDLACREEEESRFPAIRAGAFDSRKAVPGAEYRDIALWEARYEPEKIQFYELVDITFARELRRVGADRAFPGFEIARPVSR